MERIVTKEKEREECIEIGEYFLNNGIYPFSAYAFENAGSCVGLTKVLNAIRMLGKKERKMYDKLEGYIENYIERIIKK